MKNDRAAGNPPSFPPPSLPLFFFSFFFLSLVLGTSKSCNFGVWSFFRRTWPSIIYSRWLMSPIVAAVWLLHGLKGVKTSQGGRTPPRRRRRLRRRKKGWRKTDEKLRKIPEGRSVHQPTNPPIPALCSFRHIRPSGVTILLDKIFRIFPQRRFSPLNGHFVETFFSLPLSSPSFVLVVVEATLFGSLGRWG